MVELTKVVGSNEDSLEEFIKRQKFRGFILRQKQRVEAIQGQTTDSITESNRGDNIPVIFPSVPN